MIEYDDYRPAAAVDFPQQRAAFQRTRAETVALAQQLVQSGVVSRAAIPHNDFGTLSVGARLKYLDSHANFESKWLK